MVAFRFLELVLILIVKFFHFGVSDGGLVDHVLLVQVAYDDVLSDDGQELIFIEIVSLECCLKFRRGAESVLCPGLTYPLPACPDP